MVHKRMKQIYLFFLLFFIAKIGGGPIVYHGDRRFWTVVKDEKTYVALNILKGSVKLIFPKHKKFDALASDIKIYSSSINGECKDTNKLEFWLMINNDNHIRGEILDDVVAGKPGKMVLINLYEKCGGIEGRSHYGGGLIEDNVVNLDGNRLCFKNPDAPFQSYDQENNTMELKVSGYFKCQTFMILQPYMHVEDPPLNTNATLLSLNASFAGHDDEFWWKNDSNDSMLYPSINFDAKKNVLIDILKSSFTNPYFLRIGLNQPLPSLQFKFLVTSCINAKFGLALNLRDNDDCRISIRLTEQGYEISTWKKDPYPIKDPSKSPTLIFGTKMGQDFMFVKVASEISITEFEICAIVNTPDVAADQMVLQIGLLEGTCKTADILIPRADVGKDIEVLIDRSKIVETTIAAAANDTVNTTIPIATTTAVADASVLWWHYLLMGLGLLVIAVVVALVIYFACIRKRCCKKERTKNTAGTIPKRVISCDDQEILTSKSPEIKTAIPSEAPKQEKKKNKKKVKKAEKKKDAVAAAVKVVESKEKPQSAEPQPPPPKEDLYETFGPLQPPPRFEGEKPTLRGRLALPLVTETTTQEDPTLHTDTTQKPRPSRDQLEYYSMYGNDTKIDQPFDYHISEWPEYTLSEPTAANRGPTPELKQFENFWSCLESVTPVPKLHSTVYVNSKIPGKNVFFMVRDCVADAEKYSAFRYISNRLLEPMENDAHLGPAAVEKKSTSADFDEKKVYILRVFILSYEPLTVEIHCRGQYPLFLFDLMDCERCSKVSSQVHMNGWKNSPAVCNDVWDKFMCRVKRTPCNAHQFLTYKCPDSNYAKANPEEIDNVMVIRGDAKPSKVRECRGGNDCAFKDTSHPNNITLATEYPADGDA